MLVHGCDCSIAIKTSHFVIDVPYVSETVRENVTMLYEEPAIEGDGIIKTMRKSCGAVGVIVTPLTIGTAPFLFFLAFGSCEKPVFVSETRNLYLHKLNLLPMEDSDCFDLIQARSVNRNEQIERSNERLLYEGCRVFSFELRVEREQSIKLRIDIVSARSPSIYSYDDRISKECEEWFHSDYVVYTINGKEYKNIYGLTLVCKKENGIKTELWIRRVLENGSDIPSVIDEMVITARLLRDKYEDRCYGTFCITLKNLVLISDETNIESSDAVIGQLRFYVSGNITTYVFTSGEICL